MFQVGDKVRCLDSGNCNDLTKDKIYKVLASNDDGVTIINDFGNNESFYNFRFEKVTDPPKDVPPEVNKLIDILQEISIHQQTTLPGGLNVMECSSQEELDKIKEQARLDIINHPNHYTFGKYEVIDVIEDWQLDFRLANAVKYIARAGKKNPDKLKEDLEKAIWYIKRYVEKECK